MFLRINKAVNDRRNGIKREEGFTLIELLVVVIIIGILAAIAIPVFLGVQSNAQDSAVKADLTNLKTAVVAYQTGHNGVLPAAVGDLSDTVTIDTSNYNATGASSPVLTVTAGVAGAPATFCIAATGNNGQAWNTTDKAAPAKGACA